MYLAKPATIRIISRATRSALGHHWGVQLPDGRAVLLTPEGAFLVSLDEFAEHKAWRVVREADPNRYHQIIWRVDAAFRRPQPYRLADRNCEVIANELLQCSGRLRRQHHARSTLFPVRGVNVDQMTHRDAVPM